MSKSTLPENDDPVAILDHLLDRTEAAYLAQDFDAFATCFAIPHVVGTFEGDVTVDSLDALRIIFTAMCNELTAMGVIALHRRPLEARLVDADTVQATFSSQHVMRGHQLSEELVAHCILRREAQDGAWVITEARYAVRDGRIVRALRAGAPRKT